MLPLHLETPPTPPPTDGRPPGSAGDGQSPQPPPVADGLTATLRSAPLGREAMEGLAAATALQGQEFATARAQLTAFYNRLRSRVGEKHASERSYLTEQRQKSENELAAGQERLHQARGTDEKLAADLATAQIEYCQRSADLKEAVYAVRQAQLPNTEESNNRHKAFLEECTQSVHDRLQAEADLRAAHKSIALDALLKEWERNRPENERRAAELEEEKSRVEQHLAVVEQHLTALRKIGVTRNVSGFLFWGGSVTLAAAAYLLAEFVAKHDQAPSNIDAIMGRVRELIVGNAQNPTMWTIMAGLLPILVLVGAILLLAILLTWIVERLTPTPDRKKRRRPRPQAPSSLWRMFWSFSLYRREFAGAFDNITLHSVLLNSPSLVLLPLIACAIIAITPPNAKLQGANTAVAAAFLLSFHALSVLYATILLGPRLRRILEQLDTTTTGPPFSARAALALTVVFGVGAIALLGLTPLTPGGIGWPLIPTAIFLLVGGFALPFSIIFRGLFKDYDFLQSRREWFRRQIADLHAQPTENDLPDLDDDLLDESIAKWRSRTAALDYGHFLAMSRRYYDDWNLLAQLAGIPGVETVQAMPHAPSDDAAYVERILEHPEMLVYYRPIPDDLLERFNQAYNRRAAQNEHISAMQTEQAGTRDRVQQLEARINSSQLSVQTYDWKLNSAAQRHQDELLLIQGNEFTDELFLQEAWAVAERGAHEFIEQPIRAA